MKRSRVLLALSLLYTTQGIPFGFASEYVPVILRGEGYSATAIAALGWLQLPWHLKVLWAGVADRPSVRARTRRILLVLQLGLAATVAAYAAFDLREAPIAWFALIALAALFASTQDVFVDATAVRVLSADDRGVGNVAQVAGYRVGMLLGGAGLLVVVATLGAPRTILLCAALVALVSLAAFALRADDDVRRPDAGAPVDRRRALDLAKHLFDVRARPVLLLALTFKLGMHVASVLIKPMVVDAKWTRREIGVAVVTLGTVCGLAGAALGGLVHRRTSEPRAISIACVLQAVSIVPLVVAAIVGVPRPLGIAAIAVEHLASGLGTTVLFAALMSATRPADAGLHYTVLTSANALSIGVGGLLGGLLADRIGFAATFVVAALVTLAPLVLVPRWSAASAASAS